MAESHFKKKLIPTMASTTAFIFLSFALVSVFTWFYAAPTQWLTRIEALRTLLTNRGGEALAPAPGLAGLVVYVSGITAAAQPLSDGETGVVIPNALTAQRLSERFRIGRNASWNLQGIAYFTAPGAQLGGWTLTEPLLATTTPVLTPTRPGQDHPTPPGASLSKDDPFSFYIVQGGQTVADASAKPFATGDLRFGYRALPHGALSVIAQADKSGIGLTPLRLDDGEASALVRLGTVDAATMLNDAAAVANGKRLQALGLALASGWLVFAIPGLWAPFPRWKALLAAPLAGTLVTLAVAMAAVPAGGVGGGFFAGQFAAFAYAALMFMATRGGKHPSL